MKLIIGNYNYSSWSLRAWFFLARSRLTFEVERLALFTPEFSQRLAEISPAGRVPVLVDEQTTVWDTLAICEYVSEQHLAGAGWPENPLDRARARALVSEIHSGFASLRHALPMNCRAKRSINVDETVKADIARIDQMWSDDWFVNCRKQGVDIGILDAFSAPLASRFDTYGIELSPAANQYKDWLLATPEMQLWTNHASDESEVIEEEEAGTPR